MAARFWSDPGRMPKMAFQWYMSFGSGVIGQREAGSDGPFVPVPGLEDLTSDYVRSHTLRSFQRPSIGFTVSQYKILNSPTYHMDQGYSWNPITVVLVDGQKKNENNASVVYNLLRKTGYIESPEEGEVEQFYKARQVQAMGGQIHFRQINGNGDVIEKWTLINPIMSGIDWGQGNYTSDEIVTLSLTLQYDRAIYKRTLN